MLSMNPNIFKLNYACLRDRMNIIKEELLQAALHPDKIMRFLRLGGAIEDF
jgi:hypothetical protein